MTSTNRPTPMFKSLSDAALRTEYRAWRDLAFNNANIAQQGPGTAKKCARTMGGIMRNVSIIEGIARQRRISLAA